MVKQDKEKKMFLAVIAEVGSGFPEGLDISAEKVSAADSRPAEGV